MNRIFFLISLGVLAGACSRSAQVAGTEEPGMFLTDSLKRVVSVDTVHCRPVADELTLTGRVAFNPEKVAQVYPIFGGTVVEVRAEIGDYMRRGDVLAVIRSGEVAEYEKQRKESQHRLALARRNLHSVQDMAASGMVSEKDVMQARKEVGEAEAEAERLAEVFSIYRRAGPIIRSRLRFPGSWWRNMSIPKNSYARTTVRKCSRFPDWRTYG